MGRSQRVPTGSTCIERHTEAVPALATGEEGHWDGLSVPRCLNTTYFIVLKIQTRRKGITASPECWQGGSGPEAGQPPGAAAQREARSLTA